MKGLVQAGLGLLLLLAIAVPAQAQPDNVEATVIGFYQQYLKRSPSRAEVMPWVGEVVAGRSSMLWTEAQILGSTEYYRLQGSRPWLWVRGMYRDVTGRMPRRDEVNYWVRRSHELDSRAETAYEFLPTVRRGLPGRPAPYSPLPVRPWGYR